MADKNFRAGILNYKGIGNNTKNKKAANAQNSVNSNHPKFAKMPMPIVAVVKAIAPKTAIGEKYIIKLVT